MRKTRPPPRRTALCSSDLRRPPVSSFGARGGFSAFLPPTSRRAQATGQSADGSEGVEIPVAPIPRVLFSGPLRFPPVSYGSGSVQSDQLNSCFCGLGFSSSAHDRGRLTDPSGLP